MIVKYLAVIQARLGSTRLPGKVLMTVGGIPMVKRVWLAAKGSLADKVVVAWPERYPDLDENDVLGRFRRIVKEDPHYFIIRLTADCPLITTEDINIAIRAHQKQAHTGNEYYNNRLDGRDVQIFSYFQLFSDSMTDKEHVIKDIPNTGGISVNTQEDLKKVRALAR